MGFLVSKDGGKQTFSSQPFEMHFEKVNGILYSATWDGLLAMKVPGAHGIIRAPGPRPSPGAVFILPG
jgi:hypothetical protein